MMQQTLLTQRHMQNRGVVALLLLSVDTGRKAMTLEVRRIVTGHNASGKAIIKTDERLTAVPRLGRADVVGCEIWSTDRMPVDNSEASDAEQRKGFVTRYNYVGTGQGIVIRIDEFAPGAPCSNCSRYACNARFPCSESPGRDGARARCTIPARASATSSKGGTCSCGISSLIENKPTERIMSR